MRQRGVAKTVGLIVVALAVVCAVGYVLLQPAQGWPDESRRVRHGAGGFSIVQPKGFESHLLYSTDGRSPDEISFLAITTVGDPAKFGARRIANPPAPASLLDSGYNEASFQGQQAWQKDGTLKKTHESTRSVIFQRSGQWYEIFAHVPSTQPPDSGAWAAYFDSFQSMPPSAVPNLAALLPGSPATAPATRP